jgi:SAM-dependent methyltransferase
MQVNIIMVACMKNSVERDHIVWAYRLFLGREPESIDVVDQHLSLNYSVPGLRNAFMKSDEFLASAGRSDAPARPVPRNVVIDRVESAETLAVLLEHVCREWSALGNDEPHWSVLTAENFRSTQIGQNREAFLRSGIHEIKYITMVLQRNGLEWPRQGQCMEFGCGVGRVTLPLATQCGSVLGVDISAGHLKVAREEAAMLGLTDKVQWQQIGDLADLGTLPQVDMVYSRIVLQHNPPPVMELILLRLLRSLKPGGVAIFQLPTFMPGYSFRIDDYLQGLRAGNQRGMEMHMLPQKLVFELIEQANCMPCEVFSDEAAGPVYTSHTFVVRARA